MKWFKCCYCGSVMPETSFYRDKSRLSGYKPRCKQCEKLYQNKELRKKYESKYRGAHPEKRSAILALWYEKNKDKHKKKQASYRATEKFKINHRKHASTRRARILNSSVGVVNYYDVYSLAKGICFYCGKNVPIDEAEIDHFIPLSKGGKHTQENLRCSCRKCNRSKGAKIVEVHH